MIWTHWRCHKCSSVWVLTGADREYPTCEKCGHQPVAIIQESDYTEDYRPEGNE